MVYIALVLFGLCMGSFVNALVWRIYEQSKLSQKKTKSITKLTSKSLSILQGRSMCSNCHHKLAWNDLLPLLSWVALKGKCRYCHKNIADNPLVELFLPVVFVLSYIYWPMVFNVHGVFDFIVWLIVCTGLAALFVYDLKWMLLPNKIVYSLTWLVICQKVIDIGIFGAGMNVASSAIAGALVGGGIFYVLFQISSGKWIGGGDVKLGAMLGILVGGLGNGLLLLFIGSVLGSFVSVPLILVRKATTSTRIPFGPFLIISGIIVRLFGSSLLLWYKHKFFAV